MSTLRALTRNISWNYVQAGVSLAVYFLLTPVVVGHLGDVGFGIWVLLRAILFYLRFLDFGFHNALVKYVAEYGERRDWPTVNGLVATTTSVLCAAGAAALLMSGVVALAVVPHAFHVPPDRVAELQLATVLLGVDLLIAFPASVLGAVFEGRQRFDVLSVVAIVGTIVCAVATAIVLELGYGILALVGIEIAGTLLTAVLFRLLLRRLEPEVRIGLGPVSGPTMRKIRGYSTWTSLNEILAEGGAEVEKLLIPVLLSVSLLTPYTLVCMVAAVIFLAIEPLTDAFFPLSSAYDAKDDQTRLRALLLRGTKIVMAISLPLAAAIVAYGGAFLVAWIGGEHVEVPPGVMPLIVTSFTVTAFILTATTILLALARVKEVFYMGIAELGLAVLLVLVAVPRFGLRGLAGGLLAANALITFAWIVPYVCRTLGQRAGEFLAQSLVLPLFAVLPMAAFMLWLEGQAPGASLPWLIFKSGLAGCVYLVAFYALSLTPAERRLCEGGIRDIVARASE
ncbi:MAG: lipopolysaccharide biosynthesis protein [Gemmatimonadales bacterium]